MAGIETAALGGLSLLVFKSDSKLPRDLNTIEFVFATTALALLGLALLGAAWIFSSLSSLSVRIHSLLPSGTSDKFDILEQPMYARWSPRLGVLLTAHHWLWGLGLLALGGFIAASFLSR